MPRRAFPRSTSVAGSARHRQAAGSFAEVPLPYALPASLRTLRAAGIPRGSV